MLFSLIQPVEREVLGQLQLSDGRFEPTTVESAPQARILDLTSRRQPIDRDLSDSQVHSYQLELPTGRFLRVDFHSTNLDLLISLSGPGGRMSSDWIVPRRVSTPISWITEVSGNYLLKVRSVDNSQDNGVYRLDTRTFRQAAAQDQKQVGACRALSDAAQLRREWTRQSLRKAVKRYEQALGYWQTIADRPQEAATLKSIGDIWEILSDHNKALTSFDRARALYRELKDTVGEVKILNAICASYNYRGEFQKALQTCRQELATVNDSWERGQSLHNSGAAYYGTNEMQKATSFLNEALRLRQTIHDRSGQAETLLYLGYVHHAIKDTADAERYYQQSLELWRAAVNPRGQALTLTALGHLANISGERQQALSYYDQSSAVFQTIGELAGQCSALQGMAYLYSALGQKEKALQYFLESLGLARRAKDVVAEGNTLDYISEIYRDLGDYETAIKYSQKAVLVNRSIPSILGESYALANLGRVLEALGKENTAMESYVLALDLSRKGGDPFLEGLLLNAVGHLHHVSDQLSKALDYYQQAFSLQERVNDSVRVPSTLYNLARAERDQGNLDRSIRYAEQALEITETLRGKVASRQLRGSFLASVHQQYELAIDLLMRQHKQRQTEGFNAAGLQASERARARSLLDMLTEARLDIRQGAEPDLLERERALQRLLNAKAEHQARLPVGKYEKRESAALAKEISALTTEYEQVQGQLRSKSPRYAALTQPQPLVLQEIQHQVLDDQTLLLEYALGDERSYLWVVGKTSISSYELPGRAEIEKAARGVYDLLTARQSKPGESAERHRERVTQADAQYWQKAASLSEMLIGPAVGQLTTKRLLIVAEGALQYLPFGALPKPIIQGERARAKGESHPWPNNQEKGTKGQEEGQRSRVKSQGPDSEEDTRSLTPLMVHYEIVSLPSASVMAAMRRETSQRKAATKAVTVLADPVFEKDDPRVKGQSTTRQRTESKSVPASLQHSKTRPRRSPTETLAHRSASSHSGIVAVPPSIGELQRSLRDVGLSRDGLTAPRLLSTRQEAEAILSVIPAGEGSIAIGFDASRAKAMSPELGQYRIIHFATHGLMNNAHPELSGLMLSLVDEEGRPQDGFLRLHDIYNLNLPADLVVLSACNTALGQDVRGEGLVGIVRGFMYAGAARVVASLWKVDDEATAELMKRFYRHMLQEKMQAAAALRAAQVEMWQQKQWQSPYFWAAFSLQGEWK